MLLTGEVSVIISLDWGKHIWAVKLCMAFVQARVENDTFLSRIVLGLNTVYCPFHELLGPVIFSNFSNVPWKPSIRITFEKSMKTLYFFWSGFHQNTCRIIYEALFRGMFEFRRRWIHLMFPSQKSRRQFMPLPSHFSKVKFFKCFIDQVLAILIVLGTFFPLAVHINTRIWTF